MQTVILTVCIFIFYKSFGITRKNEHDRLIQLLAEQQGVTEQLKAENQLKWVGLMNNIKAQTEEMIFAEIVYARNTEIK